MWTLGMTGGVASGKSVVAQCFGRLGAAVVDADKLGHELLDAPEMAEPLRELFGAESFDTRGRVRRREIARQVFGDSAEARQKRHALEAVLHPAIEAVVGREMRSAAGRGESVFVIDAPLLIESGWVRLCNRVIYVSSPRSVRLQRAKARGWSEADFAAREAAQEPLELKRLRADLVVDSAHSVDDTHCQVECIYHALVG